MKNDEAKFILEAYRANGSDASDATFAASLKQAESDPGLREWFARKQAHDSLVASKLAEISPPAGLRESILAGARAGQTTQRSWTRPVSWGLAAAAALAIAATMAWWSQRGRVGADSLVEFALNDVAHGVHDGHGQGVTALQGSLGQLTTHLAKGVPLDLQQLKSTGCRVLSVAGSEVVEVCFERSGTWFHLYVSTHPSAFRGIEPRLRSAQREKLSYATWSDSATGYRYAVVGEGSVDAIRSLL